MTAKLTKVTKVVADLTAADVGALAVGARAADSAKLEGKTKAQVVSEARSGLANASTTINGHPISSNVTLDAADVGAAPSSHTHDYIPNSVKGKANGVATLDSNSKIPQSQIPAVAVTDTFTVANQTAMLALVAQRGDVAIRTDIRKTFILVTEPANDIDNWTEFLSPSAEVTSVNGQKGAVSLDAGDVGAEPAFSKNTAFNKAFGTGSGQVAQGNDSRIVNAVPNGRKVCGKPLTADITLAAGDVGALPAAGKSADSAKLEGKTKAQVVAEARSGLAAAGASYTKAESDGRYQPKGDYVANLKDALRVVHVTLSADAKTVALPSGRISAILFLSVNGIVQNGDAFTLSGTTVTLAESIKSGDIVTVVGFK